jgi:hypothetical protein
MASMDDWGSSWSDTVAEVVLALCTSPCTMPRVAEHARVEHLMLSLRHCVWRR